MNEQDADQRLITELIAAAVLAGAYRRLARTEPSAAGGLLKLADKHSRRVADLASMVRDR